MTNTTHTAFFGDAERAFRLSPELILELEHKSGVGIGAFCGRLFRSEFRLSDISDGTSDRLAPALDRVRECRERCVQAASRRARVALEAGDAEDLEQIEGEWLSYAALLVQVDRIAADLAAPLPT